VFHRAEKSPNHVARGSTPTSQVTAQIAVAAPIHAFLFFQNTGAKRLLFNEIECLGDRKRIGLWKFFENRRLLLPLAERRSL